MTRARDAPSRCLSALGPLPVALTLCSLLTVLVGCDSAPETDSDASSRAEAQMEAQSFLDQYTETYLKLYYDLNLAEWDANTRIVAGDDGNLKAQEAAHKAFAEFSGSQEVIDQTRALLKKEADLTPFQARQLSSVLYQAANHPQIVPEMVEKRIAAEAKQTETLLGFSFSVDGKELSTNALDDILTNSIDLNERLAAWEASKEVGRALKDGLGELVTLRNGTVRALGYDDYFHYQVSDYGMTVDEMMSLNQQLITEIWPLYRELHTWARHTLAERYGVDVPGLLPAHWLPNRWGQDWVAMVRVEGLDLDDALADKSEQWIVEQAEDFYMSLGFDELPQVFWDRSSLFPLPEGADYRKSNHAGAWHLDLQNDVRSLMSVQPNQRWWSTTHHQLGHIYYYLSYTRPEVPPLLRGGANRGFHEAVGSLLGLASMQRPFLVAKGLADENVEVDEIQALLSEALGSVVMIPFSAGTMTHFERDLYATDLPKDQYNARWWQYVETLQGIEAPTERGEEYCDAASKTHINNDAAQYYDYAVSRVLVQQLHRHIAGKILNQDPRATNYYGQAEVGEFLRGILKLGSSQDWRQVMEDKLGEEMSASAMLEYFAPLSEYLRQQNQGREHVLPEQPAF